MELLQDLLQWRTRVFQYPVTSLLCNMWNLTSDLTIILGGVIEEKGWTIPTTERTVGSLFLPAAIVSQILHFSTICTKGAGYQPHPPVLAEAINLTYTTALIMNLFRWVTVCLQFPDKCLGLCEYSLSSGGRSLEVLHHKVRSANVVYLYCWLWTFSNLRITM